MKQIRMNTLVTLTVAFLATLALTFSACTNEKEKGAEIIKIGAILPLTGNIAFIGENFRNGLSMRFEEKSQRNMSIVYEDSKAQPKEAVSIVNRLLMDDYVKIIVTNLSSVTNAIIPILLNSQKPVVLMASLTSQSDLTSRSPYVFRYFLSSQDEVKAMTSYFKKAAIDNIGVLYLNDDFGEDAVNVLKKLFDGEIVYEDTFTLSQKDFKSIIAKVKSLEYLYIIGYGPNYGLLVKQLREFGYKGKIYAFSSLNSPIVLNTAGDAARGVIFTGTTFDPGSPSNDVADSFVRSYKNRYNKLPDHYAAYGYDIGAILAKLATTTPAEPEQLKAELLSLGHFTGVFGETTIDDSGDFHFEVMLYQISDDGKIGRCDL